MHYDIAIIGGGLVGAGLLASLSASGLNIVLIEAKNENQEDPRLFALNQNSCQWLENLNLLTSLLPYAAPIHEVHVSHQGHFGAIRLNRSLLSAKWLGQVIPAKFINAALIEALSKKPVNILKPATLIALHQTQNEVTLSLNHEGKITTLSAKLVIGADGTESTVRQLLAIPTIRDDYQQSAIVARIHLNRAHQSIAYERFTKNGAIAMLPLAEENCALIWTSATHYINSLLAMTDAEFLANLQTQFGYRLGRLKNIEKRYTFSLHHVEAEDPILNRVMLIGNAAHTLHPIAAQGFNLAIHEVAVLCECIEEFLEKSLCLDEQLLRKAALILKNHQKSSLKIAQKLATIFNQSKIWHAPFLQSGFLGLELFDTPKKYILQKMMGQRGFRPKLFLPREF